MEILRQFLAGIAQAWKRLSLSARVNLALASIGTAAAIILLVVVAGRTEYVPLFGNLSPEDVEGIQAVLADKGIPFRLQAGGRAVEVPLRHRSSARVYAINQGLPKSTGTLPGFEDLGEADFMATKFQQDVKFQRAVMGQIQQQLNQFDFVNASLVTLREAKEELFAGDQQPSEAAVTVDVGGRALTKEQKNAIVGVVSNAGGAYLSPDHIIVVTNTGDIVHRPAQEGYDYASNSRREDHLNWEQAREDAGERALRAMGRNSVVEVALRVDYSQVREHSEEYDQGATISSMTRATILTSREGLPEGPTGAMAALPEGAGQPGTATEESEDETYENFQPTLKTTEVVKDPGTEKELDSVTAFVEGTYTPEVDADGNPTGNRTYVPNTEDDLDAFRDMLIAAVGFGASEENVKVYDQRFDLAGLELAPAGLAPTGPAGALEYMVQSHGWTAAQVILVLLALFIVRRLFLRSLIRPEEEKEEVAVEIPTATAEEMRKREIAAEVDRLSNEEPEMVASLLRSWLSESEE